MKNPQSRSTVDMVLQASIAGQRRRRIGAASQPAFQSRFGSGSSSEITLSRLIFLSEKDSKDEPSFLASLLQFLKYTPEQIDRIERFVDKIASVASAAKWVVDAVTTVKDLLVLAGALEDDDEEKRIRDEIAAKVAAIYDYLKNTDRKEQYDLATDWRSRVQGVRNEIGNLTLSRTQGNLVQLRTATRTLKAVHAR